jgi:hypothetical protein
MHRPAGVTRLMHELTLDDATRAKLGALKDQVRVRDSAGQTVGFLLPPGLHREMLRAWVTSPFREEEADRARAEYREHGGFTTAQALDYLRELGEGRGAGG